MTRTVENGVIPTDVLLSFDTSTSTGSVAVVLCGELAAVEKFKTEKGHAAWLLPRIDRALTEAGTRISSVSAVAVGTGPGSYTGVKVSVSTAKALSLALDVPLIGIPSLDVMAAASGGDTEFVAPVLDAKRGMLYSAVYRRTQGDTERISEYLHVSPDELLTRAAEICSGRLHIFGETGAFCSRRSVPAVSGEVEVVFSDVPDHPPAEFLARLAIVWIDRGMAGDAVSVLPIYLKKPV